MTSFEGGHTVAKLSAAGQPGVGNRDLAGQPRSMFSGLIKYALITGLVYGGYQFYSNKAHEIAGLENQIARPILASAFQNAQTSKQTNKNQQASIKSKPKKMARLHTSQEASNQLASRTSGDGCPSNTAEIIFIGSDRLCCNAGKSVCVPPSL